MCTKTIYNYIDLGLIPIKAIDLPLKVKLNTKRSKIRKNRRILGASIEERPDISHEFGHWEIDTMVGSRTKGEALLTIDEKLTRMCFIVRIKAKTAQAVTDTLGPLIESFGSLKEQVFKSITADNDSEFATLQRIFPDVPIYYCHPYSSIERGLNEKQNSMVRRHIPKGMPIERVTNNSIECIGKWINNLPRKILGYETALERFKHELNLLC